jgi:hypothetical protein
MKRLLVAAIAVMGVWACGGSTGSGEGGGTETSADTLTRQNSRLPQTSGSRMEVSRTFER